MHLSTAFHDSTNDVMLGALIEFITMKVFDEQQKW